MLIIGSLRLQSPYLLAPLEGVSDVGFRALCYANGAGITWTEMVRAKGIVRENAATLALLDTHDPATLTGAQLFVVNERELADALAVIDRLAGTTHPHLRNIRAIDLNFGCPSPDVVRLGAGPALLKREAKMRAILTVLRSWKEATKLDIGAIGLKIRLGLNEREAGFGIGERAAKVADGIVDYIAVHARHARQRSSASADWGAIRRIKEAVRIPVIGNGDAFTADDARRMVAQTGCDGVLLARGAIANPWVFRALSNKGLEHPTTQEIEGAIARYQETAERLGTRPKYRAYHEKNFSRILNGTNTAKEMRVMNG